MWQEHLEELRKEQEPRRSDWQPIPLHLPLPPSPRPDRETEEDQTDHPKRGVTVIELY